MSISVRLIAACAVLLFLLPFARAEQSSTLPDSLAPVVEIIEKNYWRDISRDSLIEIIRSGDLTKLDPYSELLDSIAWSDMHLDLAGSFGGIGVFMKYDSALQQHSFRGVFLGSPALAAGLRAGDRIVTVDSQIAHGMSQDVMFGLLRGKVGTTVRLTVQRDSLSSPLAVEIQRAKIEITSVRGSGRQSDSAPDYRVDTAPEIAYLRITHFSSTTAADVDSALTRINASGAKALILDLRDNYGGLMRAARQVADMFLDSGVIVSLHGRAEDDTSYTAEPGTRWTHPVAMLINDGTVSSGEILAAALQDNRRVITIGSRTYGKGLAQDLFALPDSIRGLKLSTSAFFRPSRQPMERHLPGSDTTIGGVSPDSGMAITGPSDRLGKEYIRVQDTDDSWQFAGTTIPLATPTNDSFISLAVDALRKRISR
ncbi:MAG: S41 family peptidase [bacterium]|nr:S41 family peptidase [bacterium]